LGRVSINGAGFLFPLFIASFNRLRTDLLIDLIISDTLVIKPDGLLRDVTDRDSGASSQLSRKSARQVGGIVQDSSIREVESERRQHRTWPRSP
jgi:hypothetical protein